MINSNEYIVNSNATLLSVIVNDYINDELLSIDNLSKDTIPSNQLANGIINRLFLRKFRKYKIDPDVRKNLLQKVNNIVNHNLPIQFIPSFGGYKHWWSPTFPAVDWAEVFSIKHFLQYISPITNSYKQNGIQVTYESEELVISRLNNVPQSALDEYSRTFGELVSFFDSLVGDRETINFVLARDQYPIQRLNDLMDEMLPECTERFSSYDLEDQKLRIQKAKTNFLINGVIDYSGRSEEEMYEVYRQSRILDETFLDADFVIRGDSFFESEISIPILFTFGLGPGGETWLHIGSCASSMVDFWAGMGVFELRSGTEIIPRIISRTQYEKIKDKLVKVPINTPLSSITNNFNYAYVYEGELIF